MYNPISSYSIFSNFSVLQIGIRVLRHFLQVKLTSANYLLWKNQHKPLINCFELNTFIDSTIKPPLPTYINKDMIKQSNPAYLIWYRKNQLLKSWILSSLYFECIPNSIGLQTSMTIWDALQAAYSAPTNA